MRVGLVVDRDAIARRESDRAGSRRRIERNPDDFIDRRSINDTGCITRHVVEQPGIINSQEDRRRVVVRPIIELRAAAFGHSLHVRDMNLAANLSTRDGGRVLVVKHNIATIIQDQTWFFQRITRRCEIAWSREGTKYSDS